MIEAMKQALEALESCEMSDYGRNWVWPDTAHPTAMANVREAITSLRQALANEALDRMAENARELGLDYEPVAKIVPCNTPSGKRVALNTEHQQLPIGTDLYTRPQPAAQWVGLTDEDLRQIILAAVGVAESKLKEKNT